MLVVNVFITLIFFFQLVDFPIKTEHSTLCLYSNPYNTCGVPSQKMPGAQKIAYKSLVVQYYHLILVSIFLSACFLSIRTGFVFMFGTESL